MSKYQPIDCNYYDYIEHFAVLKKPIAIEFYDEQFNPSSVDAIIRTTLVSHGEESIILDTGQQIRMDKIISLDGIKKPSDSAGCSIKKAVKK